MFQLRQNGRVYNTGRDIINLFRVIAYDSATKLAANGWPSAIKGYAQSANLTEKDLTPAAIALAKFINLTTHSDCNDFTTTFVNSGMAALPGPVILTLMAAIGQSTLGTYYQSVRSSTEAGRAPYGADGMGDVLDRAAHALRADSEKQRRKRAEELNEFALPTVLESDHAVPV